VQFPKIVAALQRRLELPRESRTETSDWEEIEKWLRTHPDQLDEVIGKMAEPLAEILRWRILPALTRPEDQPFVKRYWPDLHGTLKLSAELSQRMVLRAAEQIERGLKAQSALTIPLAGTGAGSSETADEVPIGSATATRSQEKRSQTKSAQVFDLDEAEAASFSGDDRARDDQKVADTTMSEDLETNESGPTKEAPASEPGTGAAPLKNDLAVDPEKVDPRADQEGNTAPSTVSQSSAWRYLPIPDDPDKHTEFDERSATSPEGLKIIGARARGKKHKHEGTNCDDWFTFGTVGPWTIIAVSDGAGSKVYSRIGAQVSCETALNELTKALSNHVLRVRDDWSGEGAGKKNIFAEEDLQVVREALHNAMRSAYDAVAARAQELIGSEEHKKVIGGREVVLEDLSATLLLAVHATVIHEDIERSFVMTCQIGDGMLAAVDGNGGLKLMGVPDSGEFAGQTDFLTSRKKLEKASLAGRTFGFFGPLRALMVMSDGVADDYFPNDPGMLRLYGDLAVNGILQLRLDEKKVKNPNELIEVALQITDLRNTHGVSTANFAYQAEEITPEGAKPVMIRSVETYAEKLGLEIDEVVSSTPLLIAGAMNIPDSEMSDEKAPEVRLRIWIDSYHVRGSFDDRTLVALYREVA